MKILKKGIINIMNETNLLDLYPLIDSNWKIPFIGIVYLIFVTILGPVFMKKRTPIKSIKTIIIPIYNIIQIIANGLIVISAFREQEFLLYSAGNLCGLKIPPIEFQEKFIWFGYMWCLIKISDLLDTVFFILLKKFSHITFLHVYHHVTTMLIAYIVVKWIRSEQNLIYAAVNCFIHVIMYSYYLCSALGYKPPWKKLVTIMQLSQFFGLMLLTMILLTCQINPKYFYFSVYGVCQCIFYLYLFLNFYMKSYSTTKEPLMCTRPTLHMD